jgi:hypothetical protein
MEVESNIRRFPMVLTIVALLLFLALVVAWVVLPGSVLALPMDESADPLPANTAPANAATEMT